MAIKDTHDVCLECLTGTHVPTKCLFCTEIPFSLLQVRYGLMGDALQQSKWPSDWRSTLARAEQVVWADPAHNSPSLSPSSSDGDTALKQRVDPRSRVDPVNVVSQNQGVESPDSAWKTGVDQSISGFADSLKLIQDSLSSLVE